MRKGGPGSGNWGHRGRPGKRGGSVPGGGAAANLHRYILNKRASLETPVAGQIREQILAHRPDLNDHQVDMFMGVISMDRERFAQYAEKVGYDPGLSDSFFKEVREADTEMERLRLAIKDQATYHFEGRSGRKIIAPMVHTPDSVYDKLVPIVGENASEVMGILKDKHGVSVSINTTIAEEKVHEQLSRLSNALDQFPVLGKIFRAQGGRVRYETRPSYKPTANASWDNSKGAIMIWNTVGGDDWPIFPSVWVHELGHAAENYANPRELGRLFGRGRMVSSYAWTNGSEDFAETFTAYILGDQGPLSFVDPSKIQLIQDALGKVT